MMNRKDFLRKIQELEFMCIDLQLFLDTHPDCKDALIDYNNYAEQLMNAKQQYESMFGPLQNFGESFSEYPWQWVQGPWPWEQVEN